MKRSFGNRRAVIDFSDDALARYQPAEKIARKEEESAPFQEVLDLKKRVAELEKDFQSACRCSRHFELRLEEAQNRVEFLQATLDKKQAESDEPMSKQLEELQMKFDSLTAQNILDRDRAIEEQKKDRAKIEELTKHRDGMQRDLIQFESAQKKLIEDNRLIGEEREGERKRVFALNNQLESERAMSEDARQQLFGRIELLKAQHTQDRRRANDELMRYRARIDELTCKLSQYEGGQQQHSTQMQQLQTLPAVRNPSVAFFSHQPTQSSAATQPPTSDATNIFNLCDSETPQSTSVGNALCLLRALYCSTNKEWIKRLKEITKNESIMCNLCNKQPKGHQILEHFFSKEHSKKVVIQQAKMPRDINVAVSTVALEYWTRKLKSIPKPTSVDATKDDVKKQNAN